MRLVKCVIAAAAIITAASAWANDAKVVLLPINPGVNLDGDWVLQGDPIPLARPDAPFAFDLKGKISPYYLATTNWALTSGVPWISLSNHSGILSGTPSLSDVGSSATIEISATRWGKTKTASYTLTVGPEVLRVRQISAGYYHTCAITPDYKAKCWGYNASGEVGNASMTLANVPESVIGINGAVTDITTGESFSCAISAGAVYCWGANFDGILGAGAPSERTTAAIVPGLESGFTQVTSGDRHACALNTVGEVYCWGDGSTIGNGTTSPTPTPSKVSLPERATAIDASHYSTCAVGASGKAHCWGRNGSGLLGDGTTISRTSPVEVAGLTGVVSVSVAFNHSCAVLQGGRAVCWGANNHGQLGDGSQVSSLAPVEVSGIQGTTKSMTTGYVHTCAVTTAEQAYCWGNNSSYRLGNNDPAGTAQSTPVLVPDMGNFVKAISSANAHTCAFTVDGGAKCWGNNAYGQKGDGTTTLSLTPTDVQKGN